MKQLLVSLLLGAFLGAPVYAANTATSHGDQPIKVCRGSSRQYTVAIDTVDTALTVHTPVSYKMACLAGAYGVETNAANVTFMSDSTDRVTLELAANQGLGQAIGSGIIYCTGLGEALKVKSSAAYSSMLLTVVETENCDLGPGI